MKGAEVRKRYIIHSILGGISISIFAGLSVLAHNEYVAPFVFMLGIIIIINYGLSLITRDCPLGHPWKDLALTLAFNLSAAFVVGLLFRAEIPYEVTMRPDLLKSVLTGVIIGIVALVNRDKTEYTVLLTVLLMYAFVYCKLPHCVVYAFYLPICKAAAGAKLISMGCAVAGNVAGGLLVNWFDIYYKGKYR